jgi:hypothetical protein
VIACVALAVSLGGIGYAAVTLPRNSVGQAQLKPNAVVSSKVKNGALQRRDFAKGQLPPGTEKGLILVSVPSNTWVVEGFGTATPTYFADVTRFTQASAGDVAFGAGVPTPLALYGKRMRVLGAEICYEASAANVTLDAVVITVVRQPSSAPSTTPAELIDNTDRHDAACRVYTLSSPATLTENDSLVVGALVHFTAGANVTFGRSVAILQATTTAAVKPTG